MWSHFEKLKDGGKMPEMKMAALFGKGLLPQLL